MADKILSSQSTEAIFRVGQKVKYLKEDINAVVTILAVDTCDPEEVFYTICGNFGHDNKVGEKQTIAKFLLPLGTKVELLCGNEESEEIKVDIDGDDIMLVSISHFLPAICYLLLLHCVVESNGR